MIEKNNITEEVTITPVIKDLERLFNRFIRGIWNLLYYSFKGLVSIISTILNHFILFATITIIGGAIGFFSINLVPRQYESNIILKLNIESKDQLKSDIQYLNSLINNNQHEKLASIFVISSQEASELTQFSIQSNSSIVEKVYVFNELYKATDSVVFRLLDVKELMNDDNSELSKVYKIGIKSVNKLVFEKLESPLLTYIERVPELQELRQVNIKALAYERTVYLKEIDGIDTLKKIMNLAIIAQAENTSTAGSNTFVNLGKEDAKRSVTLLDLQERNIFFTKRIMLIDQKISENKTCYFVQSHLNKFGKKIGTGRLLRAVIIGLVFFIFGFLIIVYRKWRKNEM